MAEGIGIESLRRAWPELDSISSVSVKKSISPSGCDLHPPPHTALIASPHLFSPAETSKR